MGTSLYCSCLLSLGQQLICFRFPCCVAILNCRSSYTAGRPVQGLEGLSEPGGPLSHFDRELCVLQLVGWSGDWVFGPAPAAGHGLPTFLLHRGQWGVSSFTLSPEASVHHQGNILLSRCFLWLGFIDTYFKCHSVPPSLYYLNIGSWALRLDLELCLVPVATLVVAVLFPVISKHGTSGSSTSSSSSSLFQLFIFMCMTVCAPRVCGGHKRAPGPPELEFYTLVS